MPLEDSNDYIPVLLEGKEYILTKELVAFLSMPIEEEDEDESET